MLERAAAHPDELVLAVDASHTGMREASRRADRAARRGGLPNARFIVSSLEALPPELNRLAALVTVSFPWGSLLRAALGQDPAGARRIAALLAPGGALQLLVTAAPQDAGRGAAAIDLEALVAAYGRLGLCAVNCRPATIADAAAARSSWGRRLLAAGGDARQAWLVELRG